MTDLAGRVAALPPERRAVLAERLAARRAPRRATGIPARPPGTTDVPLSFAQERLWFLDQLSPGNPSYNLSFAHALGMAVDHAALERALSTLVERHEALRTVLPVVRDEPVQRVLDPEPVRCPVLDLRHLPHRTRRVATERLAARLARQPFDLAEGPLFRCALVRLGEFGDAFVFVVHHVVADGWSLEVIFRELSALYADAVTGAEASLPPVPVQYADFAIWQREQLAGASLDRLVEHWRGVLDGVATLELPTDRPRPPVPSSSGSQLRFTVPPATVERVRDVARRTDATPFMVLLAAFTAMLHAYTGQDDVVVGTPVASRNRAELEGVVGFFANSLVLRTDLAGDPTFLDLVRRTRAVTMDAYEHQDLPFSRLVSELNPGHDTSRNPIFQVSFQLLASHAARGGVRRGTDGGAEVPFERGTAVFDLALNLAETDTALRGQLEFSTDLFDVETVAAMRDHYLTLLDHAVAAPGTRVGDLDMLTPAEHARLDEWEPSDPPAGPGTELVTDLLAAQVRRTPDAVAVAVAGGPDAVTYRELDERATRLAGLVAGRVGAGGTVGVRMRPSVDLVTALLAVLRSGNAYVPVDPETPSSGLAAVLADAGVRLLLADAGTSAPPGIEVLTPGEAAADPGADVAPVPPADPLAPAYVMFTSGSTGRPKGVVVDHRSLATYVRWCAATYPLAAGVGAPLVSSVATDMAVTSVFTPLVTGRTVVLLEDRDVVEALDTALRGDVRFSFVKLTPSHLHSLRNLSLGRGVPVGTCAFVVGGEALRGETLAPWRDAAPDLRVWNEYGPTETTVACCAHEVRAGDVADGPVPIGRPIAGAVLQVLDRHGRRVPVGVPGELLIGGPGVARGYLGDAALTATRFEDGPAGRRYRSGDRVRRRRDGTLEYLGRVDRQLKIRGHRVEPGEIEAVLGRHPGVRACAVVARELGPDDRRLVAYVVTGTTDGTADGTTDGTTDGPTDAEVTREVLELARRELRAPMVPSRVVVVRRLPVTRSGKVDLRALEAAAVDGVLDRTARAAVPPRTPLERVVAMVLTDVLDGGAPAPSGGDGDLPDVEADFFAELGGDSLLATKVVARLREYLAVDVPLRLLFEQPSAGALSHALRAAADDPDALERRARVLLEVLETEDDAGTDDDAHDGGAATAGGG